MYKHNPIWELANLSYGEKNFKKCCFYKKQKQRKSISTSVQSSYQPSKVYWDNTINKRVILLTTSISVEILSFIPLFRSIVFHAKRDTLFRACITKNLIGRRIQFLYSSNYLKLRFIAIT